MVRLSVAQRAVVVASGLVAATVISSPAAMAAACGPGTFYDAPSDTCLVAALEPAPPVAPPPPPPGPPPPPAWNGPTPQVFASICAPIPLVNLCVGI